MEVFEFLFKFFVSPSLVLIVIAVWRSPRGNGEVEREMDHELTLRILRIALLTIACCCCCCSEVLTMIAEWICFSSSLLFVVLLNNKE